jgi:hypothetical protein
MKTPAFMHRIVLPFIISSTLFLFQACQKTADTATADQEMATTGKPPKPQLSFNNCRNPVFSGNFVQGSAANISFTLNYTNGSGASYPSFTSTTVNGITIKTPPGTLNTGAGSITFTAIGTPVTTGSFVIPVSIGGSAACNLQMIALNPSPTGSNGDPGATVGSTGNVSFNYHGQMVTYKTVRAADGKIWLQQNLGSPRVAFNSIDETAYGHFFQWGRWDDGHQLPTSPTIAGNSSLQNPLQIAPGNPAFIQSQTPSSAWWGAGGLPGDTWNGNVATSVNGKDPCVALGAGWRMPTAADWQNVIDQEGISNTINAFQSNLKLAAGAFRPSNNGIVHYQGDVGYYWSSTAEGSNAKGLFIDNAYGLFISPAERGNGYACRCVKN